MAKKREESTNEKIVRLYKEGHSFDDISRTMEIPKGNIIGIIEKYFPEYQTYVQPKIDHSAPEEKNQKGKFGLFGKGGKNEKAESHEESNSSVNLEMDENGFVDRTVEGIAKMLKNGKSVADVADFFNRDKSDIKAVQDVMDEHFRRQEAAAAAAKAEEPAPAPEPEEKQNGRAAVYSTGLEPEKPQKPKSKYKPPVYTKGNDPKPVSAAYGMTSGGLIGAQDKDEKKEKFQPSTRPFVSSKKEETPEEPAEMPGISLMDEIKLATDDAPAAPAAPAEDAPAPTVSLVVDETPAASDAESAHEVKLVPDEPAADTKAPEEEHKVSLLDSFGAVDENPEMPSIELVSPEQLDKELTKAPDPVENIPAIGAAAAAEEVKIDLNKKEDNSDMTPVEKMKQFAQEQIALNNKKIEELKNQKTDAENVAFDANTKVEAMKKQIEELQSQLLVLIKNKDEAGKAVSDINEQIDAINQENVEFGNYL